jgi:hypothetical protein
MKYQEFFLEAVLLHRLHGLLNRKCIRLRRLHRQVLLQLVVRCLLDVSMNLRLELLFRKRYKNLKDFVQSRGLQ